jgi:hypothetical protein
MTTRNGTPAITDSHRLTNPPEPGLTAWLGDAPHTLDGDQLVLHTDLGDMHPRTGWTLLKWSDGEITVASPRIVERVYGPGGLLGQAQDTVTRVQALADRWAKAGPPPLGTSINRWVDARLIELNTALDQTAEH